MISAGNSRQEKEAKPETKAFPGAGDDKHVRQRSSSSSLPPLLREFEPEQARRRLNDILFRGRTRPATSELVSNAWREKWSPLACDGVRLRYIEEEQGNGCTHGLDWEHITLNVSDSADMTQSEIVMIVCRRRGEQTSAPQDAECTGIEQQLAVVMLHSTMTNMTCGRYLDYVADIARAGLVGVGVNTRYHGCRSKGRSYFDALVQAYNGELETRPFIYDSCIDLSIVADYLLAAEVGICTRLAITGVSLGGMHAWFAAACDTRWEIIVPMIGVQSFRYAVESKTYHARVDSLKPLFDAVCKSEKKEVCEKLVAQVWNKICPGLMDGLDGVALALLWTRDTLIVTGELDERCPVEGVRQLVDEAERAWRAQGKLNSEGRLTVKVYEGVGHQVNEEMWRDCVEFVLKRMRLRRDRP